MELITLWRLLVNFGSFFSYYIQPYRLSLKSVVGGLEKRYCYQILAKKATRLEKTPYLSPGVIAVDEQESRFYQQLYFERFLESVSDQQVLPDNGIIMSTREVIPGLKTLETNTPYCLLHTY